MSARRDSVARDLHERVMAACADDLAAHLAVLHGPQNGPRHLLCHGCDRAAGHGGQSDAPWPCGTYRIITAHVLDLDDVDAVLKSMRAPKLSSGQITLMRFFAGQRPDPPRRTCDRTYQVLIARGLIERHGPRRAYRLTERGEQVLAALGPVASFDARRDRQTASERPSSLRARRPARKSSQKSGVLLTMVQQE